MAAGGEPIRDDEADAIFDPLLRYRGLILAVSGGADSTAMMHLVQNWRQRKEQSPGIVVVTVDHGLRPESTSEAAVVALQAKALGLEHRTLAWEDPKPSTGIQAAAREARYRLLAGVAHQAEQSLGGETVIVTAHTADDQAETFLMRLARGSGVDGLSAIPALSHAATGRRPGGDAGCLVVRPLIGVPRARLVSMLNARGIAFIDDPSNRDVRYERVRARKALDVLETLGVSREALARTVARLQSAKDALDHAADLLQASILRSVLGIVYEIDRDALVAAPAEIAIRVLRCALDAAGGEAAPAELGAVEEAYGRIAKPEAASLTFTLGGCIVEASSCGGPGKNIRVYREPGRRGGLPSLQLEPGGTALWDRRFRVEVWRGHPRTVEIGPLGADWMRYAAGYAWLSALELPQAAGRGLPAFREGEAIVAVPLLADYARQVGDEAAAAALAGPSHVEAEEPGQGVYPNLRMLPVRKLHRASAGRVGRRRRSLKTRRRGCA